MSNKKWPKLTREQLLYTKIRIKDEEHSTAFQEACFEVGVGWMCSGRRVKHIDQTFLYVNADGELLRGERVETFLGDESREIFFEPIEEEIEYPNPQHKHKDLIIAWASGAEIEKWGVNTGRWHTVQSPFWTTDTQYRIKPKQPAELDAIEAEMRELAKKQEALADKLAKLKET